MKRVLILVLAIIMLSVTVQAQAADVFQLTVCAVDSDGEAIATPSYSVGDEILIKVDYHAPYANDYADAVEGVSKFCIRIDSDGLSDIAPLRASTLCCTDVACYMHDDLDVLTFDAATSTVSVEYGYSGYIVFSAKLTDTLESISVTMCYGDMSSPIYEESVALSVHVDGTVVSSESPMNTEPVNTTAPVDSPRTGHCSTNTIAFALALIVLSVLLIVATRKKELSER